MNTKELRENNVQELNQQLTELRKEQLQMRIQKSMGQLKQTHRIREVRLEVARIKTILNERKT